MDKFRWAHIHGNWFAIWGVLNLIGYGIHLYARPDNYNYYFSYTGEGYRLSQSLKSMVASDNWLNIAWTAPSLIGLNFYLHQRLGSLFMTKFFVISLVSSFFFLTTFNPKTGLNFRPLHGMFPKFDSDANDGSYLMGASPMALSIIYFTLLYHRLWMVALPLMVADTLYFGPAAAGGPVAALVSALILI